MAGAQLASLPAAGVAEDRVISTVDPEARHGHKTASRGFDGYKGHISLDPDSEIIVATEVTAGNVGDAVPAAAMLEEVLQEAKNAPADEPVEIYGDSSYGTAALVEHIEAAGAEANVKVQPASAANGRFAQDAFSIDTDAKTVQCPRGVLVQIRLSKDGSGTAEFAANCASCQLNVQCTNSRLARTIRVNARYETLAKSRAGQREAAWKKEKRGIEPHAPRSSARLRI